MKKRILCLLLGIAMIFTLGACGDADTSSTGSRSDEILDIMEFDETAQDKLLESARGTTIRKVGDPDEMNDYEMIRDCHGVAMGNGNEKVKEIAKFVTLSNEEDGIAYYLNNYIFKEENK